MKKLTSVLLLVMLISGVCFATGTSEKNIPPESVASVQSEPGKVTEIVFLSSSVKPYDIAMPEMIKKFEAENPDIKVKIEQLPTKNIWEMIEIKLGAKESTPDVVFTDAPLVTPYVVKDYLEPLEGYFTQEELSQFVPVALEACSYNGKLYSAPFLSSCQVLYYNTEIFDKLGIEHLSKDPKDRLTWEEVVELAKKLTIDEDKDGVPEVFGLGISQISRPYQMLTMPESLGGQPIGKDGLEIKGVLTDEAWLKSCQFIQDLFNKYGVAPKGVSASDMLAYFPSGKLAMMIGPDYNVKAYSAMEDFKWDYAPYPYFEGGKAVTPTGSWSLSINKNSKNKEAAARLIKFITLAPECVNWFEMDGHLPTNKNTYEYIANSEKYREWPFDVFTLLNYEANNTAIPRPLTPGYLEYESMLTNAFEDIRNGSDVKSTLENAEIQIDKTLRKYR